MKWIINIVLIGLGISLCGNNHVAALDTSPSPGLNEILDRVENRYATPGFSVYFFQISTLKAMNVTDYANGRIFARRPGMMRWEYNAPNPQLIVADNKDIWIYRPEDNQVSHGAAPEFFKGGNGAGFLSDMTRIRKDFNATLESTDQTDGFRVKLLPKNTAYEVTAVYLTVSAATFEITVLSTLNAYGDETRFELSGYQYDPVPDLSLFQFKVPEGVEVLTLDQ